MGLFSNKKKGCPVCGNPTPRLFATKIEDMPLCKDCAGTVFLPVGAEDSMSLSEFEQYLGFYDRNKALRDAFNETYRQTFGLFSGMVIIDEVHNLFRINGVDEAIVYEGKNLRAFRITEDHKPIYEGNAEGLICHASDVPDMVYGMSSEITRHKITKRAVEFMEKAEREEGRSSRHTYMDLQEPFKDFHVELYFNHPYWREYELKLAGPTFNNDYPSADDYMRTYNREAEEMRTLAKKLIALINPAAPMMDADSIGRGGFNYGAPAKEEAPSTDVVAELKKYKELLDMGIITEEEFVAKKRQLMGI